MRRRRRHNLYRRDKPIALARHRLDVSGLRARVAQPLPNLENCRASASNAIDEDVRRPQPLRDVVVRYQFLWTLQQQEEEIHWLPREPNAAPAAPQLIGGDIDLELSEAVDHASGRSAHAGITGLNSVTGDFRAPPLKQ